MKCFLGIQFAAQIKSTAQKEKCPVHGRQNFLPVDIHKAALWKQGPLGLFIVLGLLPRQPEANSLGGDWHTFLLFISCPEYSNAFCALGSLLLGFSLFQPLPRLRACSPTAFQNPDRVKPTWDCSP